jgi:hypothetical protein
MCEAEDRNRTQVTSHLQEGREKKTAKDTALERFLAIQGKTEQEGKQKGEHRQKKKKPKKRKTAKQHRRSRNLQKKKEAKTTLKRKAAAREKKKNENAFFQRKMFNLKPKKETSTCRPSHIPSVDATTHIIVTRTSTWVCGCACTCERFHRAVRRKNRRGGVWCVHVQLCTSTIKTRRLKP